MGSVIYLDYNATTPTLDCVIDEMSNCYRDCFANPASSTHSMGAWAACLLETMRDQTKENLSKYYGLDQNADLIFTSGATEANNFVIRSIAEKFLNEGHEMPHIITTQIEHKCILESCRYLEKLGASISYVSPNKDGRINSSDIERQIQSNTKLISVMAANNETGVLQPVNAVAEVAKKHGIFFHVDAAQLIGKATYEFSGAGPDFLSFSAHKFYGPKGVGGLLCKCKKPLVDYPIFYGGGQEFGLRSGTVNLPGIVGMSMALSQILSDLDEEVKRQQNLKNTFIQGLYQKLENFSLNGDPRNSLPNTINFSIDGIDSKDLMRMLKGKLAISAGSACASNSSQYSHVLKAMGVGDAKALASFRLSFGRDTTKENLSYAIHVISDAVKHCREFSGQTS